MSYFGRQTISKQSKNYAEDNMYSKMSSAYFRLFDNGVSAKYYLDQKQFVIFYSFVRYVWRRGVYL